MRFRIHYDDFKDKDNLLTIIASVLKKGNNVRLEIHGLVVKLTPGMDETDIENEIKRINKEFEDNKENITIDENESLLSFAKRITKLAKETNSYFTFKYHDKEVKVCPDSEDFDIFYQIVQINKSYIQEQGYEEVQAQPGIYYTDFGEKIFEMLKNGEVENAMAIFNGISIPFTKDMVNHVYIIKDSIIPFNPNGNVTFVESDAYSFASMFENMMYMREQHYKIVDYYKQIQQEDSTMTSQKSSPKSENTESVESSSEPNQLYGFAALQTIPNYMEYYYAYNSLKVKAANGEIGEEDITVDAILAEHEARRTRRF